MSKMSFTVAPEPISPCQRTKNRRFLCHSGQYPFLEAVEPGLGERGLPLLLHPAQHLPNLRRH